MSSEDQILGAGNLNTEWKKHSAGQAAPVGRETGPGHSKKTRVAGKIGEQHRGSSWEEIFCFMESGDKWKVLKIVCVKMGYVTLSTRMCGDSLHTLGYAKQRISL